MSPAEFFTRAVATIQRQHVEPVSATQLADRALRELESVPPAGAIRVLVRDNEAVLTHGESGSAAATVTVAWPADATAADVGRALTEAGRFVIGRLGTNPESVADTLLRGLARVDVNGAYLPADLGDATAGVGLEIRMRDGALVVLSPIEGGPAERAGLRAGDRILVIDGVSGAGLQNTDAGRLLRGAAGSRATLLVARREWDQPREIVLIRERIRVPTLQRKMFGGVGYVRISSLGEQTARQLGSAVDVLRAEGATALVLDLRNSPGGLLTAAVEVSELFLPEGRLVTSTVGRSPAQNVRLRTRASAQGRWPILDLPLAVLVNDGTAAGSEIVASALQDWGRATIVGTRTAGHTRIMSIFPLANGGALKLTTSRWLTSKDRSVDEGLKPDIDLTGDAGAESVARDPDRDGSLRRVIELLARRG